MAAGIEPGPPPVRVTGPIRDEDMAELRDLLRRGEKIQAIKRHRERTGMGLKESKDAVDAIELRMRDEPYTQVASPGRGCLGILFLG